MKRTTFRTIGLLALALGIFSCTAQDPSTFLKAFDTLGEKPKILTADQGSFNGPDGGHLQGIQVVGNRIFLSGSSSDQGYLAILTLDEETEELQFLGVKPISQKPLNHAGGFQITDGLLAVGCEDPKSRNRSLVVIQNISSAEALAHTPMYSFERSGKVNESTAGAVGLLRRSDHYLLAVASWNASTIDFYTSNHLDLTKADFDFAKWTTWDPKMARCKGWVEKKTRPYQNIQLFEDETGVYLLALAGTRSNVADVYYVNVERDIFNMMTKVRSHEFDLPDGVSFKYGAGLMFDGTSAELWSVSKTLRQGVRLVVFE